MDNAAMRIGTIRYAKYKENASIEFETHCTLAVLHSETNRLLAVEFVGSDSVVNGLHAALATRDRVRINFPASRGRYDVAFTDKVNTAFEALGVEAQKTKRQRTSLKKNKKRKEESNQVRVVACYPDMDMAAADGYVPILSKDPREVIFELAQRLTLPVEAHWAGYLFQRIKETEKGLIECKCFGVDAIIVTVNRKALFKMISDGILNGRLKERETAPKRLRQWAIKTLPERRLRWIRNQNQTWSVSYPIHSKPAPEVMELIENACFSIDQLLAWHHAGHWGLCSPAEREENEASLEKLNTSQIFTLKSVFRVGGKHVEVVTERKTTYGSVYVTLQVKEEAQNAMSRAA